MGDICKALTQGYLSASEGKRCTGARQPCKAVKAGTLCWWGTPEGWRDHRR